MAGGGSSDPNTTKSEPNVVPLCDILLVLLIIFMVVTPMIKKGANVQLPEAVNNMDQPEPGQLLTVSVKSDGSVFLGEAKVVDPTLGGTEAQLEKLTGLIIDKLEEKPTEMKVLLKADNEVEYGKVVDVMDLIKNANIELLGLITEQKTGT